VGNAAAAGGYGQYQQKQQQIGLQQQQINSANQARNAQLQLQAQQQQVDAYFRQQQMYADLYKFDTNIANQVDRDVWMADSQLERDQQRAELEREQWEYQFSAKQHQQVSKLNSALSYIDEELYRGNLSDDQATEMRWEVQQQMAGIKPQAMPKKKAPTVDEEMQTRVKTQDDGSTLILQPDGKIDYRPPKTDGAGAKQIITPQTFSAYWKLAEQSLQSQDENGNVTPADPAKVEAKVQQMMQAFERVSGVSSGGWQVTPGPAAGGAPASAPPAQPMEVTPEEIQQAFAGGAMNMKPEQVQRIMQALQQKIGPAAKQMQPPQPVSAPQQLEMAVQQLQQTKPAAVPAVRAVQQIVARYPDMTQVPQAEWGTLEKAMWDAGPSLPREVQEQFLTALRQRGTKAAPSNKK